MRTALALVALAMGLASAGHAQAPRVNLPPITRTALANGLRVWMMEYRRAPTVSIRIAFPGGSAGDPEGKAGAHDLMADLLTRGAGARSAQEMAEALDLLGARLSSGVGPDRVVVSLDTLAADLDAALDLLSDAVRRPALHPDEFARRKEMALAGLRGLLEQPEELADRAALQTVYAGHPYGVLPTRASLEALTADDVRRAYRRSLVPDRAILVAVGDFKAAALVAKLRALFDDWPRSGGEPAVTAPVPAVRPKALLADKPDATQTQVRLVGPALRRGDPREMALLVASTAVGGSFTSRLTAEIRVKRSLTYGIGAYATGGRAGGAFTVSTFTRAQTTGALLKAVRAVLSAAAARGLTADEMRRAVAYLAGSYAIGVQTPEQVARRLLDAAFYGLPADYLHTYIARLRNVTLAQANAAMKQVMAPGRLSAVLVGPAPEVKAQLDPGAAVVPVSELVEERSTMVDDATKRRIDEWIRKNGLNPFGDPPDRMYAGGTPLFDERTGKTKDVYEYILEKHPELRKPR